MNPIAGTFDCRWFPVMESKTIEKKISDKNGVFSARTIFFKLREYKVGIGQKNTLNTKGAKIQIFEIQ